LKNARLPYGQIAIFNTTASIKTRINLNFRDFPHLALDLPLSHEDVGDKINFRQEACPGKKLSLGMILQAGTSGISKL
jgi:hypothetical protein